MNAAELTMLDNGLWAGAAAACFAVLLNVPRRALFACALTGVLAYETRAVLVATGLSSPVAASFVAANVVTLLSMAWGRRLHAPAVVFVMPSVIPLIPGALAFRTISDLMAVLGARPEAHPKALSEVATSGLRTALITAALAAGVAVPSMLLRRNRPIL